MFKIYNKYIFKKFLIKYLNLNLIFFCLIIIMGVLEELSFFNNLETSSLMPYFLTLLNAPSTLFEIFPFIFLLSIQFLFFDLSRNDELNLLKKNGLKNTLIIKNLFFVVILVGIFNIAIFYNFASILKFHYSNIKNKLSDDNKYLAIVLKSGLWIKDEVNGKKFIIKSKQFNDKTLSNVVISEFDKNFKLIKVITSEKVDIENNLWIVYEPQITLLNNKKITLNSELKIFTNFNHEKINILFTNISNFNLIKLLNLKSNYNELGYSTVEINLHLLKIISLPLFYGAITILASIIMLNFMIKKSFLIQVILGILTSIFIYYLSFLFSTLGANERIPIQLSVFFPIFFIFILSVIGLININEK